MALLSVGLVPFVVRVFGALLAVASGTVGFVPLGILLAFVGFVPFVELASGSLFAVLSVVGSVSDMVSARSDMDEALLSVANSLRVGHYIEWVPSEAYWFLVLRCRSSLHCPRF